MTDLEQICENALYDEIRVLEDGKSVVRDIPTGKLYFKKTLDVYNEHVFTYLRDHRNRHVTAVQSFWKEGDKLVVIEELLAADYEGAAELRDEIYTWRAAITTGMSYSFGPMQSAYIKCKLAGGPPDGTAIVKYEIYDFTRGETDTWTDKTEHRAGETSEVDYSEEDSSYSLFDRTYRVRIYVNGDLVETWEGQFSTSF